MDCSCSYFFSATCLLLLGYVWLKLHKKSKLFINLKQRCIKRNIVSQKRDQELYAVGLRDYDRVEPKNNGFDNHLVFGADDKGNSLLIKINKFNDGILEAWIVLRLNNGDIFTTPKNLKNFHIECQDPYNRLRLTYNGLLRRTRANGSEDDVFIKFNFFFISASIPQHWPNDWNASLMASAVASGDGYSWELLNEESGYDQYGALYGQVFLDSDEITVNLPGVRERRWSTKYEKLRLRKKAVIYGICEDGSCFIIGSESFKLGVTQAQFGSYRKSNGDVISIDWTDFDFSSILDNPNFIKQSALTVQFCTSDKRNHRAVINLLNKSKSTFEGSSFVQHSFPVAFGLNSTQGTGNVILYDYNNYIDFIPEKKAISKLEYSKHSTDDLTFFFDTKSASNVLLSGGKGASLALLAVASQSTKKSECLNFVVPQGFIVSSKAFDRHVSNNQELSKVISDVKNVVHSIISGDLEEYCSKTVKSFEAIAIDSILKKNIIASLEVLRSSSIAPIRFAVRSSAIEEDGEEASSAGQNETFLGLHNDEEILKAVQKCWASLYALRSVKYRHQHIQPVETSMAVVIQLMVPSESAGVLFTQHPVSGNPNQILITGNYGLGESVVSGEVDPDVFLLEKFETHEKIEPQIVSMQLGQKTHQIRISEDGTNVTKEILSPLQQAQNCLTNEQILNLAKIGIALEHLYGNPRDIEWAIYKSEIFLLQSRPITTQNPFTDWELLHEFDMPTMSKQDYHTRANVGEVMPDPVTPLTLSIILNYLERQMVKEIKNVEPSHVRWCLPTTHYRATMNIFNSMLMMPSEKIEIADKVSGFAVCGHDYITPEMHRIAVHRNSIASGYNKFMRVLDMVVSIWRNAENVNKQDVAVQDLCKTCSKDRLKSFTSSHDLLDDIKHSLDLFSTILSGHTHTSKVSTFCDIIKFVILLEQEKEITNEHYEDVAKMLSGCNDVISAEIPTKINEIAKIIKSIDNCHDFLAVTPDEAENWLKENCVEAFDSFRQLIERHHHRAYKEFELCTETYGMRPQELLKVLQNTVSVFMNATPTNSVQEVQHYTDAEVVSSLKTPKSNITRSILKWLLPLSRKSVRRRELTKDNLVLGVYQLKMAIFRLSELMVNEGLLPDKKLIFYFSLEELDDLIHTKHSLLLTKATRRMKLLPTWAKLKFPEIIVGLPQPLPEYKDDGRNENFSVTGTPVFGGIIEGRACVLKSFDEVHKIQPGDILITHSTDIGWSPYFPILGGVVTELGGLISHGAVVAREYGLPCIVGAQNATDKIHFGENIVLNASKGTISII